MTLPGSRPTLPASATCVLLEIGDAGNDDAIPLSFILLGDVPDT
jgi:hypothetical protein